MRPKLGAVVRWFAWVIGAAGLVALTACVPGELHLAGEEDGSTADAARDTGGAHHDATVDASPLHDAGSDRTSMIDASPPDDTGPADAGPLPPVYCGDAAACAVPADFCCVRMIGGAFKYSCEGATGMKMASCSGFQGTPVSCEQGADCPGHFCCGTKADGGNAYETVECQNTCDQDAGSGNIIFCNPDVMPDECAPFGKKCKPSMLLPGLDVCDPPF
jgi:hypothetical protein